MCFEIYVLQSETWITDSEHCINTTRTDVKQCHSEDAILEHLQNLVEFMKPGCERQDGRVSKLGELASKINVERQRKQVRDLVTKHKRILLLFKRLERKLQHMAEEARLCEVEGREIQVSRLGLVGNSNEVAKMQHKIIPCNFCCDFRCDFLLLVDVNELINNECAECMFSY
jgi:hypothetical protein